ncbi:MAG: GGDEF domain-containing protein [Rhodospirillaceae bacterium]|nr:GGDEF domain-containing protein [Rhodospirillales bacterium]
MKGRARFQGWLVLAVLTAAILATFFLLAWRDLTTRYEMAARQGHDTTWFIGRNVAEKFRQYDRQLSAIIGEIESAGTAAFAGEPVWHMISLAIQTTPFVRSIGLYDETGRILQHSDRKGGFPDTNVADRDYFRTLKANPGQGLFITRPFKNRGYEETIIGLARAIMTADGKFTGVALIAVSPEAFDLLGGLPNLPRDSAISIHRRDGINLFRAPLIPDQWGKDLSGTALFTKHLPTSAVGVTYTPTGGSTFDSQDRLLAYRTVEEWPLVVVVGILRAEIAATWRQDWTRNAVFVGLALIGFSWLATIAQRQTTGRLEAELNLSRRELQHRAIVEEELRRWATTDSLTGMANRRHFLEHCEREMQRALRYSRPMPVLIFDVDLFKTINDRFGHAMGDEALKIIADVAAASLRETDLMGRLGGEEFGVLLPETDTTGAADLAERLRAAIAAAPMTVNNQTVPLSISVGVAMLHPDDTSVDALFNRADQALYRAKHAGRNRVVLAEAPTAMA